MAVGDILRSTGGDVLHKPNTELILRYGSPAGTPVVPPPTDPGWYGIGLNVQHSTSEYVEEQSFTETIGAGDTFTVNPPAFGDTIPPNSTRYELMFYRSYFLVSGYGETATYTMNSHWEREKSYDTYTFPYGSVGPAISSPLRCTGLFELNLEFTNMIYWTQPTSKARPFSLSTTFLGRTMSTGTVWSGYSQKLHRFVFNHAGLSTHINDCMTAGVISPFQAAPLYLFGTGNIVAEHPDDFQHAHVGNNYYIYVPAYVGWGNIYASVSIHSLKGYFANP